MRDHGSVGGLGFRLASWLVGQETSQTYVIQPPPGVDRLSVGRFRLHLASWLVCQEVAQAAGRGDHVDPSECDSAAEGFLGIALASGLFREEVTKAHPGQRFPAADRLPKCLLSFIFPACLVGQ